MKLNNKGYLLVEIIVASVLAMTIAYFLIDLTLNLKEKNDDIFVDTILTTDKVLITDQIMRDINKYKLTRINQSVDTPNIVDLTFSDITKRITIKNEDNKYTFQYGQIDETGAYTEGTFIKEFNSALDVADPIITTSCYQDNQFVSCNNNHDKGILKINIDAYTLYSDINYGIAIEIPYNTKELTIIAISPPDIFTPTITDITTDSFTIHAKANSKSPIKEYEYYVDDVLKCKTSSETCNVTGLEKNKTYTVYVKATNEYDLSTNSNKVNVTLEKTVSYLFYTSSRESSSGNYTAYMDIYRCNSDGSNCVDINNANGFANGVGGSFGPLIYATNNYFYYASAIENRNNTTTTMELYRCNKDGTSCSKVTNIVGFANSAGGSFAPSITANNNYLFYTTSKNDTAYMDVYRCNTDGSNCVDINNAYGFANGVGGSFGPLIYATNNYFYYASATVNSNNNNNTTTTMQLYKCNADGTSCSKITNIVGFANGPGGSFAPAIIANNNYLFYITSKNDTAYMDVYRCNTDGSNCVDINNAYGFANGVGGSFGPLIYATNNYFYYASATVNSNNNNNTTTTMQLYKCNADGTSCSKITNIIGFANGPGGSISPQIIANDEEIFYTTSRTSSSGNYTAHMNIYHRSVNANESTRIQTGYGFANGAGGSFGATLTISH